VFFYSVLIFVTADVGGPLNLVLIPCSNLIAAVLFTFIFFFPLSKLADWLSQKLHPFWQLRINSLLLAGIFLFLLLFFVIGGFTLVMGVILDNPLAVQILGKQNINSVMVGLFRFLFHGGIPFLLGGSMYWFLLQSSRKILASRKKEQR
jgi:hypothetical protein